MKNILKLYEKKKMKPKYINFSDLREKKKTSLDETQSLSDEKRFLLSLYNQAPPPYILNYILLLVLKFQQSYSYITIL